MPERRRLPSAGTTWAAFVLAGIALAVTPFLPHRNPGTVEVCTAAGVKRIDVQTGEPASPAREVAGEHCLVCGAASALDATPGTASLPAVRIARSEAPRRIAPLAPKAGGGAPLGARAPPRAA